MNEADKEAAPLPVRLERRVRLFRSLPLGTRFQYEGGTDVCVILERHDCGLIAKWEGVDGWVAGQSICSFMDTPEECETGMVILCDA